MKFKNIKPNSIAGKKVHVPSRHLHVFISCNGAVIKMTSMLSSMHCNSSCAVVSVCCEEKAGFSNWSLLSNRKPWGIWDDFEHVSWIELFSVFHNRKKEAETWATNVLLQAY